MSHVKLHKCDEMGKEDFVILYKDGTQTGGPHGQAELLFGARCQDGCWQGEAPHLARGGGARGSGLLTPPSPGGEPARPWKKAWEGPTGLAGDRGALGLWDVPLERGVWLV